MKSKLIIENAVGTEVNVKKEDINKLVVLSSMFGLAFSKGLSVENIRVDALDVLKKTNGELKEVIKSLDSSMWCKRRLLSGILHKIEEFQQSFNKLEWKLLLEQTTTLVKGDLYSLFSYCDKLDWDDLIIEVIKEFRKMGILLYKVSIKHKDEDLYYYLFDPNETDKLEIRDFVLKAISYDLDEIVEEYGHYVSENLLKKVWSKRDEELKPIFWETKSEKLREQFWREQFLCCVCDRDIANDF